MRATNSLEWFQRRILSTQAGLWVGIGVLVGVSAGVGSLLLYNGIILVGHFMLYGIAGFVPPLPVGEGGASTYSFGSYRRLLIPISTTLGGFISGYLVYKLTPGSEGLGINAAINAFHNLSVRIKNRTPAVKLAASAVSIGSGGSAGRDGPVALISAVFGSFLSDVFKLEDHDRRIVIASAIGAGIGSIFMAPIGGAILSTEILYRRDFEVEALIPATVASVVGYAIFGYQFHYVPLFAASASLFLFVSPASLLLYALAGLLAGLGAKFYIRIFDLMHLAFMKLRSVPAYVRPAIGGLFVGLIGIFYPQVLGLGYGWVQLILAGNLLLPISILLILFFAKIIATSLTIGSGGAGGAFAPSIVTGAFLGTALGDIMHPFFPYVSVAEVTVVTMLSFFAGASKTPVSMLIIGTEMVGGLDMFLPLMVSITIAFFVTGNKYAVYDAQVLDRLHSPAHMLDYRDDIMDQIKVREAMNVDHAEIGPDSTVFDTFFMLRARKLKGAIVSDEGKPTGYVTVDMLRPHLKEEDMSASRFMKPSPPVVSEDSTVRDAIHHLPEDSEMTVVVTDSSGAIVGSIGFNEIADAYEKHFREFKISEMRGAVS